MYYSNGDNYQGAFSKGSFNGSGVYVYISGEKYMGEWKNGKSEGEGTYHYSNGSKYQGTWIGDQKNGKGVYYYNDGKIFRGWWVCGRSKKTGIYYCKDGTRYEAMWRDDVEGSNCGGFECVKDGVSGKTKAGSRGSCYRGKWDDYLNDKEAINYCEKNFAPGMKTF